MGQIADQRRRDLACHEFGSRRSLWLTKPKYKYIAAAYFAKITSFHRFEALRSCVRYSECGVHCDTSNYNRWALLDDFVKAVNDNRAMFVTPSDLLYVYESISRWYWLSGEYVDVGLPKYRAIDRKTENGCEIKSSACKRSGIMRRLEVIKSLDDDSRLT